MSKVRTGITQAVLDAVWKVMGLSNGRQFPVPKVKLDGRRGYGDSDIPSRDKIAVKNDAA
jgi:hypothetical protein